MAVTKIELAGGAGAASLIQLSAGQFRASVLSHGAALVGFETPDSRGRLTNCVVTLADPADLGNPVLNPHLGGVVGRCANRIAEARFELDGVTHHLEANEGRNTLHCGSASWDQRRWRVATTVADATSSRVALVLADPDGSGGFPGRVDVVATYQLQANGTLTLMLACTSDRPTVVAPTNHTYWNLAGAGTIADHRLAVQAETVLELGPGQIPTGTALSVADGPLDLRAPVRLGDRLDDPELLDTSGFDHTMMLGSEVGLELPLVGQLSDPASGRTLEMRTDQPALHLYTGNHLGGQPGTHGPIPRHGGVCLEAGQVPNGPNLTSLAGPDGPIPVDVALRPGRTHRWVTSWRLGAVPIDPADG